MFRRDWRLTRDFEEDSFMEENVKFNILDHIVGYSTGYTHEDVARELAMEGVESEGELFDEHGRPIGWTIPKHWEGWMQKHSEAYNFGFGNPNVMVLNDMIMEITKAMAEQAVISVLNQDQEPIFEAEKQVDHVCRICKSRFPSSQELTRHLVDTHKITLPSVVRNAPIPGVLTQEKHICPSCQKAFTGKLEYIGHVCSSPLECVFCTEQFKCIGKWMEHVKKSHEDKFLNLNPELSCIICASPVKPAKHNLLIHYVIHIRDHNYFCPLCGGKYKTSKGLTAHLKQYHTLQELDRVSLNPSET